MRGSADAFKAGWKWWSNRMVFSNTDKDHTMSVCSLFVKLIRHQIWNFSSTKSFSLHFTEHVLSSKKILQKFTPPKTNGWNLEISPEWKGGNIHPSHQFLGVQNVCFWGRVYWIHHISHWFLRKGSKKPCIPGRRIQYTTNLLVFGWWISGFPSSRRIISMDRPVLEIAIHLVNWPMGGSLNRPLRIGFWDFQMAEVHSL